MDTQAKQLAENALKCAGTATEAMNAIDQASLPDGVFDVLYQQNEALGKLSMAVILLVTGLPAS